MENNFNNEDFFDYDDYVKSGKKKKKKPKKKIVTEKKEVETSVVEKKIIEEGKESIENIKKMFDNALDENSSEIAEFSESEILPEEQKTPTDPLKIRRRLYLTLGALLLVLSIVGLFSSFGFLGEQIRDFADNTEQKNEFEKFIYPIVICDPPPFDKNINLRSDTVVNAAIWNIILYSDKSKYQSDFDYISVPEVDVEQQAIRLFGPGMSIEHQSIKNSDIEFFYEPHNNSYRIPVYPITFTYSPKVVEITKVGERYTLTVGYLPPTPAWKSYTGDDAPEPEKYLNYIVSKRGDEYSLVGIEQIEDKNLNVGI